MSTTCYEGVSIIQPILEICNGEYKSDVCVLHAQAIPDFNLPINSSLNTIIETMKTIIVSQNLRTTNLETEIATLKARLLGAGIP